jgi:DNA-binding PadR family transcriptional regulator
MKQHPSYSSSRRERHTSDGSLDREHRGRHRSRRSFGERPDDDVRSSEHGPGSGRGRRGHGFFDGAGRGSRDGFGRGGGGRFFGPGDLSLLLLWLIGEKPRHGYELIKAVEQLVGGAYSPSPGSVYPILSLLEDMGQIAATSPDSAKKLFAITDDGRTVLSQQQPAIDGLLSRMRIMSRTMGGMRPPEAVFQVFQTLKTAVALHRHAWTDDEVQRVCGIINAAIAAIQADGGDGPA